MLQNIKKITASSNNKEIKLSLPLELYYRSASNKNIQYSHGESQLRGLSIDKRDIELIKKAIIDDHNKNALVEIYRQFERIIQQQLEGEEHTITVYTDGSLIKNKKIVLLKWDMDGLLLPRQE